MNITVDTDTTDARRLLRRSPNALAVALEGTLNDASSLYLLDLKTYPPSRASSSYKRTRTLARSWSRSFSGSGLVQRVLIGSNRHMAPYNRGVQDDEFQYRIHHELWGDKTVQSVSRRNLPRVVDFLQRRVDTEIRRLGR